MRHVSDEERRARIGVRHALAERARTAEEVTRALTVLHSTEAPTVYLSCWARMDALKTGDVDRALYEDRSLVKQLAMRRTLFVFPRDLVSAAWAGPSARVAATEKARMAADVVTAGIADDGEAWLADGSAAVLELLAGAPEGLTAQEIRLAVPAIDVKVSVRPGSSWTASRVLTQLGAAGRVMRGSNTVRWHNSRPRWTLTDNWITGYDAGTTADDGYRELVRRWLYSFGPGTEDDVVWWLGATKGIVRRALAELDAVPVTLDHGATGWLLPDDVAEVESSGPWAALLPVLDPTVMGWKHRDFYLGPHRDPLFDRSGNAGTTAWVNGRVVGAWDQNEDATVRLILLEKVSAPERRRLEAEAERLTAWLDGFRVPMIYRSPAMREAL